MFYPRATTKVAKEHLFQFESVNCWKSRVHVSQRITVERLKETKIMREKNKNKNKNKKKTVMQKLEI